MEFFFWRHPLDTYLYFWCIYIILYILRWVAYFGRSNNLQKWTDNLNSSTNDGFHYSNQNHIDISIVPYLYGTTLYTIKHFSSIFQGVKDENNFDYFVANKCFPCFNTIQYFIIVTHFATYVRATSQQHSRTGMLMFVRGRGGGADLTIVATELILGS